MWRDMFVLGIPVAEKIIRTILVYMVLAVLFRFIGKRGMASLNTFDFVVMFLLSNVVQNAVIGNDNSLLGGVIGAVTLVVVNALVNRWLVTSNRAERILEGTESTIITDGRLRADTLRRLAIRPAEIDHAVRLQNGNSIDEIADGRLEPGGHLVLTLKATEQNATRGDLDRLDTRLASIEAAIARLTPGTDPDRPAIPENDRRETRMPEEPETA